MEQPEIDLPISDVINITQLISTDVTHRPHASMNLSVVQHPTSCRTKKLGTLFTGNILQGAEMIP